LAEIAYESAVRALDKQERVLEQLRARTGIVLGASSVAASLLGRFAYALRKTHEANKNRLRPLARAVRVAAMALAVEIVALTVPPPPIPNIALPEIGEPKTF
jgi:hypothetical protein